MTPPSPLQLRELSDKKAAIESEQFKQAKRELCANPSWIERQRIKLNVWLVARKLAKSDGKECVYIRLDTSLRTVYHVVREIEPYGWRFSTKIDLIFYCLSTDAWQTGANGRLSDDKGDRIIDAMLLHDNAYRDIYQTRTFMFNVYPFNSTAGLSVQTP